MFSVKVIVISVLILFGITYAYPCSCSDPSIRQKFRSSDLVIVGKVIDYKEIPVSDKRWSDGLYLYSVNLALEKKWKGPSGKEIEVLWAFDTPGMCNDLSLTKGESYLIYTRRDKYGYGVYPDCGTNYNAKYREDEIKKLDRFWFRSVTRLFPFPKL